MKINDVAARYHVSTRTLRYYEEIEILWSYRPDPAQPRHYTPDAVRRLEQILALRRLQTPIREFQRIVTLQDPAVALGAFTEQIRALEREAQSIRVRRERLERLLALFRREQAERPLDGPDLPEEIAVLAERAAGRSPTEEALPMTAEPEIRIIALEPIRVARYHDPVAPSCFDSWRHMIGWASGHGLKDLPATRAFGHTSPNPEGIIPKYGYDVLLALPDGFEPRGHIQAAELSGGLYAVTSTCYRDYVPYWRALGRWVREHPLYERRPGPPLEELHVFGFPVNEDSPVDLLYPIQLKA